MSSLPTAFYTDPELYPFITRIGPCPLQVDAHPHALPSLYESLAKAVTGQQLSSAAATTIFKRLCALTGDDSSHPPAPAQLLSLPKETLRGCGLSGAKVDTLFCLAQTYQDGALPSLEEAARWSDEALITSLTRIKGIGRWTAEMLLLFTLHRPDVFPAYDLGVREGWRRLKGLEKRPSPAALKRATAAFSPHRSTLTWYCWEAKARLPDPSRTS